MKTKEKTIYINIHSRYGVETIDEFPYNNKNERKYAREMWKEYNIADRHNYYYLSQRCTNEWKNKKLK
jgi:hypothetical protein